MVDDTMSDPQQPHQEKKYWLHSTLEFTSLPFKISTFANRATKTNLGIPPLPGSAIGFSESLMSCNVNKTYESKG
jgi:hypothetical protein